MQGIKSRPAMCINCYSRKFCLVKNNLHKMSAESSDGVGDEQRFAIFPIQILMFLVISVGFLLCCPNRKQRLY